MDSFDSYLKELASKEKKIVPDTFEDSIEAALSKLQKVEVCSNIFTGDKVNVDFKNGDIFRKIGDEAHGKEPVSENKTRNKLLGVMGGSLRNVVLYGLILAFILLPISLKLLRPFSGSNPAGESNPATKEFIKKKDLGFFINSTIPSNNDSIIPINEPVTIKFNVKMDRSTLNSENITVLDLDNYLNLTGDFNVSYDEESNTLDLSIRGDTEYPYDHGKIEVSLSDKVKDAEGDNLPEKFSFTFGVVYSSVMEKDKADEMLLESVVLNKAILRSGPGDNYKELGTIEYGETILLRGAYKDWFLAESNKVAQFWIKGNNVLIYNYDSKKDIGIITEEDVKVGGIHFKKGNLVWILKQGDDKSYVRPIAIDIPSGYSGWLSTSSYTKQKTGVYFNQAFIKPGAKVYEEPNLEAGVITQRPLDENEFSDLSSGFVSIENKTTGEWVTISAFGGISGWVKKSELYIP